MESICGGGYCLGCWALRAMAVALAMAVSTGPVFQDKAAALPDTEHGLGRAVPAGHPRGHLRLRVSGCPRGPGCCGAGRGGRRRAPCGRGAPGFAGRCSRAPGLSRLSLYSLPAAASLEVPRSTPVTSGQGLRDPGDQTLGLLCPCLLQPKLSSTSATGWSHWCGHSCWGRVTAPTRSLCRHTGDTRLPSSQVCGRAHLRLRG